MIFCVHSFCFLSRLWCDHFRVWEDEIMIMGLLLHGNPSAFPSWYFCGLDGFLYVFVATVSNILAYLNLSKHFNELWGYKTRPQCAIVWLLHTSRVTNWHAFLLNLQRCPLPTSGPHYLLLKKLTKALYSRRMSEIRIPLRYLLPLPLALCLIWVLIAHQFLFWVRWCVTCKKDLASGHDR